MERTLKPLRNYADMKEAIEKAGAWFIGSFMMELIDNYEKFQERKTKTEYIHDFMEEYEIVTNNMSSLRTRINRAIQIIESGMVKEAMEYVLNCNDEKLGCEESKVNAKYLLRCLENGECVLPVFED